MPTQAQLAVWLILLEAAAFGYFSSTILFPASIALVALASLTPRWRFAVRREQQFAIGLLLALGFLLKSFLAPYQPPQTLVFLLYPLVHAIGQFLLTWQVVTLALRQESEPLPAILPLQGVLVLICTADIQTTRWQSAVYQGCVLSFVTLAALYFGASRTSVTRAAPSGGRSRSFVSLLTLTLALWCGWKASVLLDRYWHDLERIFARFTTPTSQPTSIGFLRQAQLGNVAYHKSLSEDSPALRIYAATSPGYLRGAAYDAYNAGRWETHISSYRVTPLSGLPPGLPVDPLQRQLFALGRLSREPCRELEIWPEFQIAEAVFTRLTTTLIAAPVMSLNVDEHAIAQAPDLDWGRPYRVYCLERNPDEPPTVAYAAHLTGLPPKLDPRIAELAARIFADCTTPHEKLKAVERYFHQNYAYRLGIEIPPHVDPLTHFLLAKPAAHCEYFASGATLLLRLAGVPCRYVTGFVADERNPLGGYWLARNKDAHAWVEAYVSGTGWVIVEATPPAGVPTGSDEWRMSHLWDDFVFRAQIIRALLFQGGIRGLRGAFQQLLSALTTTLPGLVITAGLCVWSVIIGLRIWRKRRRATRRDPVFREWNRLLTRMDRQLKRWNLERRPSETLHQFAARIKASKNPAATQAAAWYLAYAALRYQGLLNASTLQSLRQRIDELNAP